MTLQLFANVPKCCARAWRTYRQRRRACAAFVVGMAHDKVEERFFTLDVEVEGPFCESERSGNVRHLRATVALLDEDVCGAFYEVLQPVIWNAACHGPSYT